MLADASRKQDVIYVGVPLSKVQLRNASVELDARLGLFLREVCNAKGRFCGFPFEVPLPNSDTADGIVLEYEIDEEP